MKIDSFEELSEYLRNFETWGDRGGYDFVGSVHLLGACLDNLQKYAAEEELGEIEQSLEPRQWQFLQNIVNRPRK